MSRRSCFDTPSFGRLLSIKQVFRSTKLKSLKPLYLHPEQAAIAAVPKDAQRVAEAAVLKLPSPSRGEGGARAPRGAWEGEGGTPRLNAVESHPHLSAPLKGERSFSTVASATRWASFETAAIAACSG